MYHQHLHPEDLPLFVKLSPMMPKMPGEYNELIIDTRLNILFVRQRPDARIKRDKMVKIRTKMKFRTQNYESFFFPNTAMVKNCF